MVKENISKAAGQQDEAQALEDPSSFELLCGAPDRASSEMSERRYRAQKKFLSLDISHQKGVKFSTRSVTLPGRVSLSLVTLTEFLGVTIGFAAGLIHFSVFAPNYLIALCLVAFALCVQVMIYNSSYRTQRIAMTVIQLIATMLFMTLVDWAFIDLLIHPRIPDQKRFLLGLSTVGFNIVPLLMFMHAVYLGRSSRTIEIQRRLKGSDTPTVRMDPTQEGAVHQNISEHPTK